MVNLVFSSEYPDPYPLAITNSTPNGPVTFGTDLSMATVIEIKNACRFLYLVLKDHSRQGTVNQLKNHVKIYPSYIHFEDKDASGVEILVTTDGLAYWKSKSGVVVRVTPNSLKVKELNGQIKDVDVADPAAKKMLSSISSALAEEAKDWVASAGH